MTQGILNFDSKCSEAFRDTGTKTVLENEDAQWKEKALGHLERLARERQTLNSDDLRFAMIHAGMLQPHHSNCFGALFLTASKKGWIVNSNRYEASKILKNHARKIPVWLSLIH